MRASDGAGPGPGSRRPSRLWPEEHGTWAFLLVPGLGILGAFPSWTSLLVVLGFLAGFLARGPLRALGSQSGAAGLLAAVLLPGVVSLGMLHGWALGPWWEALLPAGILALGLAGLDRSGRASGRVLAALGLAALTSLQVPMVFLVLGSTRTLAWAAYLVAFVPWLPVLGTVRLRVVQARPIPDLDLLKARRRELPAWGTAAVLGILAGAFLWKHPAAWLAWTSLLTGRMLAGLWPGRPRLGGILEVGLREIGWSLGTAAMLAWTLAAYSWR